MYEARVAKGAAWLDEKQRGWERRINVAELMMSDCYECVLGQIFGDFFVAVVSERLANPVEYGFNLYACNPLQFQGLRDTWVTLIKERFDTGNLSDCDLT